jgi:chromate transporter
VAHALLQLGRTAGKGSPLLALVGVGSLTLYLLGMNELALLFGAGLVVLLVRGTARLRPDVSRSIVPLLGVVSLPVAVLGGERASVELERLFLLFLKFGAVVYGSGYVLFAFLQGDLVERLGWLTRQQLVDALAVGQLTPGPVFTTATFIGYLLGGVGGAIVATVGIFLPGFVFVTGLHPLVGLMRRSTWAADLLDGVNVGAVALMAGVTWQLGLEAIVDLPTGLITLGAGVVLFRFKVNSGWLVLAGAALGLVISLIP